MMLHQRHSDLQNAQPQKAEHQMSTKKGTPCILKQEARLKTEYIS